IVSNISSTSLRTAASSFLTGSDGLRRRLSGRIRISRIAMARDVSGTRKAVNAMELIEPAGGMQSRSVAFDDSLVRFLFLALDSVPHRLNQSMTANREQTCDSLQKITERLAVIDDAQRNITDLASQMNALQNVLANKQQRGAFGQGRLEIIVRDGLPKDCYEF